MISFEKFNKFSEIVNQQLSVLMAPIINGEEYSAIEIANAIDRIIYRYSGNEDLINDTIEDKKKKVLFVEDKIDFFRDNKELIMNSICILNSKINPSYLDILVCVFGHVIFAQVHGDLMKNPPEDFVE